MQSKKILQITDCCFNLPDDFCGTCGEALMLLAQYRLQQENGNAVRRLDSPPEQDAYNLCMSLPDSKACISYMLCERDSDGAWKNIV